MANSLCFVVLRLNVLLTAAFLNSSLCAHSYPGGLAQEEKITKHTSGACTDVCSKQQMLQMPDRFKVNANLKHMSVQLV